MVGGLVVSAAMAVQVDIHYFVISPPVVLKAINQLIGLKIKKNRSKPDDTIQRYYKKLIILLGTAFMTC